MIFNGILAAIGEPDQLKRQRFPGHVYAIEASDSWQTADSLRMIPGVVDVTLFGSELHATLRSDTDIAKVIAALPQQIRATVEATELVPTLEDLFIALTREEMK